jgi:magnesium-protoporphyrin IX monomethyl ester (oxidative) cyclase
MKILAVHPSGLMYTKVFLRLEPLGLELAAQALRCAGHEVKLVDLQVTAQREYINEIRMWRPDVIAFSCNYLAHIPEVIDLAKTAKEIITGSFVLVGGHCASFTAEELLEHSQGAIDCVLKGEGETTAPILMEAIQHDRKAISQVPGVVSNHGCGPLPVLIRSLDEVLPARDLLRYPRRYFISDLDPAASIEFSRGCPWDCSFCSAWTFYSRNYRLKSPQVAVEELARIKEHGVFIVDDVAFIQESHGFEIGEAIARKGIKKEYHLETRCDVLLRNKEVFKFWKEIGLSYMYLGMEAMDDEGLQNFRKRITKDHNFEALEFARSLGIVVAVNLIVDPNWERQRFEVVRQWCRGIPEFVNFPVLTPYPGTETWYTESRQLTTRDYRLFDLQHSVLPTKLPLADFYEELVETQMDVYNKITTLAGIFTAAPYVIRSLLRGQSNLLKLFLNYKKVFHPRKLLADHDKPVAYKLRMPPQPVEKVDYQLLYIHKAQETSSALKTSQADSSSARRI